MSRGASRRRFLQSAATAGTAAGLGKWAGLLPISPITAADGKVPADLIQFSPDIEPIVRLIEETPREKCPAVMIEQLRRGLPYRGLLAALFLAGLRNRALGGHHVALLHSAHQLALEAPVSERLLPTFWALDSFKAELDRRRPTPVLKALSGRLPSAEKAAEEMHSAMESRDADRAERAVVALARAQGERRAIEALWPHGARDWFFIGHSAIWVANNWRTLQTVGARHAEPLLRFLVREIIDNATGVAKETYAASQQHVREALDKLPPDWAQAQANGGLTKELFVLLRDGKGDEASRLALAPLREGKAKAGAVWDAVHLAAGEIVLGSRGVRAHREGLHANTVPEALHFAFQASGEPANRLLLLLQAVGWMGLFRGRVGAQFGGGILKEKETLLSIVPAEISDRPAAVADEILAAKSSNPHEAVRQALAFAQRFPHSDLLRRAAARLLPLKATADAHDVKFPVAMFEKQEWVSPEWRPHVAAAAAVSFQGSDKPDSELMTAVREAVRKL